MGETITHKLKAFSLAQILEMESRFRAQFINSLGGFKSVCLVGTQNKSGLSNLAIFNSVMHIGSHPPLMGLLFRTDVVERHTLENILETHFYTINHLNETIYKQAHQTAARYNRTISEFDATGLTRFYKSDFFAPFVKESTIQIGLEFKEKTVIKSNQTILLIGEVKQVTLPEKCIKEDGFLDLELAKTITCSGLDSYHNTKIIDRLSYAKPDKLSTSIL
jgi:flavin reductase (DIM6/NTAB) family NADH-FMN oxidoreductase RutF